MGPQIEYPLPGSSGPHERVWCQKGVKKKRILVKKLSELLHRCHLFCTSGLKPRDARVVCATCIGCDLYVVNLFPHGTVRLNYVKSTQIRQWHRIPSRVLPEIVERATPGAVVEVNSSIWNAGSSIALEDGRWIVRTATKKNRNLPSLGRVSEQPTLRGPGYYANHGCRHTEHDRHEHGVIADLIWIVPGGVPRPGHRQTLWRMPFQPKRNPFNFSIGALSAVACGRSSAMNGLWVDSIPDTGLTRPRGFCQLCRSGDWRKSRAIIPLWLVRKAILACGAG